MGARDWPGVKTRTTIDIDNTVLADFRSAVAKRYGNTRGYMYDEWCRALKDRAELLEKETRRIRTASSTFSTPFFDSND